MNPLAFVDHSFDLTKLARSLDEVGPPARLATIRGWTKEHQAKIFEAAKGFRPIGLDFFVPSTTAPMTEVLHDGKNTLPVFSVMQKRFCRPTDSTDLLYGYNHQAMQAFTGPGYFVARPADAPGEVLIDYGQLPPSKPEGWPRIIPNHRRLGLFVYHQLSDQLRGLSAHVSIGRAFRKGEPMDQWFVMVRNDSSNPPTS
jgi:hypothetical protein